MDDAEQPTPTPADDASNDDLCKAFQFNDVSINIFMFRVMLLGACEIVIHFILICDC